MNKKAKKLIKYEIVSVSTKKGDFREKTFCFSCGCFQGMGPPAQTK